MVAPLACGMSMGSRHRLCRELSEALKAQELENWSAQVFSTAMWLHHDDSEGELRGLMAAHTNALRAFLDGLDEAVAMHPLCDASARGRP